MSFSTFCQTKIPPVGLGAAPANAQAALCKDGKPRPFVAHAASEARQIVKTARPHLNTAAQSGVLGLIPAVVAWNAQSKPKN